MNKENAALTNPDITCCNCLNETTAIHNINIGEMGYGSSFDGWSTKINLCDECYKLTNSEWWKLEQVPLEESGTWNDFFEYKYEDKIFEFVKQMPLAGQELFYNRYSSGWNSYGNWNAQDWIDYELKILPHKKCKEYGVYSHEEINAYQDRFPNCKHVEIKVYSDGSKGSRCFKSAFGDGEGNCRSTSKECHMCASYEMRTNDIKIINISEEQAKRERERLQEMLKYATEKLKKLKVND